MRPFEGRSALLIVTGGIAAYKSAFLARRLIEAGCSVEVVMTASAHRFVGTTTFEGIVAGRVHTDLWTRPMAHLDLGRAADVIVVAPATADVLARLGAGRADDLAAAVVLAADAPVVVCPAMNTRMWKHPATQANVERLRDYGYTVFGPSDGPLAEGESGEGRMCEPDEIVAALGRILEAPSALAGRKVVVTAGPTRAPIDPVRFLGNRSSGKMGYALASSAWRRGAEVVLISGPATEPVPPGPRVVEVETSDEMLEALRSELDDASVLLMAAAVSDFRAPRVAGSKIKKDSEGTLTLELTAAPDLLLETRDQRREGGVLSLGFALETEDAEANGRRKLERKGLDLIAVNVQGESGSGVEVDTNRVTLLDSSGHTEHLPLLRKTELADRLLNRVEEALVE